LPLFEPLETEYNAPLCEETFNLLVDLEAFGKPNEDWPEEMKLAELKWSFESPIQDAAKKEEATRFMETANLTSIAINLDQSLANEWDYRSHYRAALKGIGAPLVDEDEANEANEQKKEMAQVMQTVQAAGAGGEAAEQVGKGMEALMGPLGEGGEGGEGAPEDSEAA